MNTDKLAQAYKTLLSMEGKELKCSCGSPLHIYDVRPIPDVKDFLLLYVLERDHDTFVIFSLKENNVTPGGSFVLNFSYIDTDRKKFLDKPLSQSDVEYIKRLILIGRT